MFSKFVAKQEEEEDKKPEEEDKKKQEEDEEEDKKKQEAEDEDKKKQDTPSAPGSQPDGEPEPEKGETKLPQANAGETDETDTPKPDKIQLLEKELKDIKKSIKEDIAKKVEKETEDVFKAHGIRKTTTPRPSVEKKSPEDILKKADTTQGIDGMDIIKAVTEGKTTVADIHKSARDSIRENKEIRMKEFFAGGVA